MEQTLLLRIRSAESEAVRNELESFQQELPPVPPPCDPFLVDEVVPALSTMLAKALQDYDSDFGLREKALLDLRQGRKKDPQRLATILCRLAETRLRVVESVRKILHLLSLPTPIPGEEELDKLETGYSVWLEEAKELLADVTDTRLQDTIRKAFEALQRNPRPAIDWRKRYFGEDEEVTAQAQ